MGQDPGQERAQHLTDDRDKTPEQLRAEIEDVRQDLGDTAAALAEKTDVKARTHERIDELKRSAAAKKDDLLSKAPGGGGTASGTDGGPTALAQLQTKARQNPVPTAALGALVGGFLVGRLSRRDR